jgi:hypothetical protein
MKKEKNKTQSWLDKLQQESWQLELIISSILLLIIGSYDDKIPDLLLKYNTNEGFNFAFVIAIIIPILLFVKSNLIGHIFFRGLWIGCIGLRYISKDVDFNSFGYSNKFDNFLKKKVQPFDIYIEKLERICSIIFSYSFLMVFHFLSFALVFTIIQFLNYYAIPLTDNPVGEWILVIITLLLMISAVLNFIDFITIGKLKKTKYISNIFYPFYRVYNTFSLAFLYRPIHYNFISNKLGRTYMLLMLPYMVLLAFAGKTVSLNEYTYIPKKENAANWVLEDNYDSLRKRSLIKQATIDKLFYNKNEPIKLFIRVDDTETTNQLIEKICPNITSYDRSSNRISPFDAITITNSDDYLKRVSPTEHKAKIETSISCISKIYEVSIDSNQISPDYVFYQHSNSDENGILTGINTNELENGKHNLIIKIKSLDNDTVRIGETIKIPFFKN